MTEMTDQQPPTWILTVTTASGQVNEHTYLIPDGDDEEESFLKEIISDIADALNGKLSILYLENPRVMYSARYLESVQSTIINSDELEELLNNEPERMGFLQNR